MRRCRPDLQTAAGDAARSRATRRRRKTPAAARRLQIQRRLGQRAPHRGRGGGQHDRGAHFLERALDPASRAAWPRAPTEAATARPRARSSSTRPRPAPGRARDRPDDHRGQPDDAKDERRRHRQADRPLPQKRRNHAQAQRRHLQHHPQRGARRGRQRHHRTQRLTGKPDEQRRPLSRGSCASARDNPRRRFAAQMSIARERPACRLAIDDDLRIRPVTRRRNEAFAVRVRRPGWRLRSSDISLPPRSLYTRAGAGPDLRMTRRRGQSLPSLRVFGGRAAAPRIIIGLGLTVACACLLHSGHERTIRCVLDVSQADPDVQQVLSLLGVYLQLGPGEVHVLFGLVLGRAPGHRPPSQRRGSGRNRPSRMASASRAPP